MIQTVLAYLIVAGAGLWVLRALAPPPLKRALARRPKAAAERQGCGPDCGCGR